MGRVKRPWSAALAAVALVWALPAAAAQWNVDRAAGNEVQFTSEVMSFTFSGANHDIDGYLYWEGDGLFEGAGQVYLEVDLRTLDTGIGKRDRDLREVLETKKWPRATYKAAVTAVEPDTGGTGYRVQTRGTFTIHGVEREMEIDGHLTPQSDGALAVESRLTVRLADHRIEAPSLAAFVKVSDAVAVTVRFRAAPAPEGER
ncbi:MAG: YceI family protein [Gemmatimonadota bacterium]